MRKLNFGCGSIQPKDWDNLDSNAAEFYDGECKNFSVSTRYYSDNRYDIIVAHCSIQMTPWHELPDLFRELHRILKPGCVLRISLPDIVKGFEAYLNDNISFFPNSENKMNERFSAWLTWYSTSKSLLTVECLREKLKEAGFSDTCLSNFGSSWYLHNPSEITELDTRNGECYFVEARK